VGDELRLYISAGIFGPADTALSLFIRIAAIVEMMLPGIGIMRRYYRKRPRSSGNIDILGRQTFYIGRRGNTWVCPIKPLQLNFNVVLENILKYPSPLSPKYCYPVNTITVQIKRYYKKNKEHIFISSLGI